MTRKTRSVNVNVGGCVYEAQLAYRKVGSVPRTDQWMNAATVRSLLLPVFAKQPEQESFVVVMLDNKNRLIAFHICTTGTRTGSLVHPREVFRAAIFSGACAVIFAHNHPSGDPSPSGADIQVTRQLGEAARAVDIALHDHVIIGDERIDPHGRGYFSFRDSGAMLGKDPPRQPAPGRARRWAHAKAKVSQRKEVAA